MQRKDEAIKKDIVDQLFWDGRVVLEGTVDALWKKHHAENLISAVAGVIEVVNRLVMVPAARGGPEAGGEGNPDEAIARDISVALERNANVNESRVDVEVDNGVVTLSGLVPDRMSHDAVEEAARITHGVREIVDRITIGGL